MKRAALIILAFIFAVFATTSNASLMDFDTQELSQKYEKLVLGYVDKLLELHEVALPLVKGTSPPWFINLYRIIVWPYALTPCAIFGWFQVFFSGNVSLYYKCVERMTKTGLPLV